MNKKAFTLTELLVVIAILGVVSVITVPVITNVLNESRENTYLEQERSIVNAAKTYMANNSTELPTQTNGASICISVIKLQEEGLLSKKINAGTGIKNTMYNRTSTNITIIEKDEYFDGAVKVEWQVSKYTYTYQDNSSC